MHDALIHTFESDRSRIYSQKSCRGHLSPSWEDR
jgi:hypothetical protein